MGGTKGDPVASSDAGGSTRRADQTADQPTKQHLNDKTMLPGIVQKKLTVPLVEDETRV